MYLVSQMEEVVEIVGAQVSCAALGDVHVLRRSVRLGLERIESSALGVLQGHVDPVEQLCRLVHRGTGLYRRHHVVFGQTDRPHRQNRRTIWVTRILSVIPPFASTGWSSCSPEEPWRTPVTGRQSRVEERSGGMKRGSLNGSGRLRAALRPGLCCVTANRRSDSSPHLSASPRLHALGHSAAERNSHCTHCDLNVMISKRI